jgi:hypothetical protein
VHITFTIGEIATSLRRIAKAFGRCKWLKNVRKEKERNCGPYPNVMRNDIEKRGSGNRKEKRNEKVCNH